MYSKLTRNQLFIFLVQKANNPFTTIEQKNDVKRIMMESNTMKGINHLFLVDCFFHDNIFNITEEEAIRQAKMAFRENNKNSCYYLYLLLKNKDINMAKAYLQLAVSWNNKYAILEMAHLLHEGKYFSKDQKQAFYYYKESSKNGFLEGYFGMLLIASEENNYNLELQIFLDAKINGFLLPGVIQ